MARLPSVGGDNGNWGTVLNSFLQQSHNSDGSLKNATQTLTDGATISWNVSSGSFATVTLGGNRTLSNPSNIVDGGSYLLIVKQDGTGSRTLSFGSAYLFPDGVAPTMSTGVNAVDILSFVSDGTNMYGSLLTNFS